MLSNQLLKSCEYGVFVAGSRAFWLRPHVKCHTSHVTCHTSHATCHTIHSATINICQLRVRKLLLLHHFILTRLHSLRLQCGSWQLPLLCACRCCNPPAAVRSPLNPSLIAEKSPAHTHR